MNASTNRNSQAIHQKHKCNEKQGLEITPRFCRYAVLEHRRTKKYSVNDACHAQASKFSGSVILRAEIYTLWPSLVSPQPVTSLRRPGTTRANGNFREEICYFCGAKQPFYHTILWVLAFKQGHLPGTLGLWKHLIFEELRLAVQRDSDTSSAWHHSPDMQESSQLLSKLCWKLTTSFSCPSILFHITTFKWSGGNYLWTKDLYFYHLYLKIIVQGIRAPYHKQSHWQAIRLPGIFLEPRDRFLSIRATHLIFHTRCTGVKNACSSAWIV